MSENITYNSEITYAHKMAAHASYKFLKIVPTGSVGQSPVLSLTSTTQTQFELPNNVLNLARSQLSFDIKYTAPGGGFITSWASGNALSLIDHITLTSRSGTILADIPNCGVFGSIVSQIKTSMTELDHKTNFPGYTPAVGLVQPIAVNNIMPITQAGAQLFPIGDLVQCMSDQNVWLDGTPAKAYVPYSEPQTAFRTFNVDAVAEVVGQAYQPVVAAVVGTLAGGVISGTTLTAAVAGGGTVVVLPARALPAIPAIPAVAAVAASVSDGYIAYHLNLDAFKETLMAIDKNLYFGDNLVLTIIWAPANKFSWLSKSTSNPNPGGTWGTVAPGVNVAVTAAVPVMNNLTLYTACETDPIIISQLMQKVNSDGFSLTVPYVYCQKLITGQSTMATIQQRINRSYGHTLLRCYTSIFPQAESECNTLLHEDSTIVNYNSFMDGLRMQDMTISPADATHYLINQPHLKGSCIQSLSQFKMNFTHIESWGGKAICQLDDTVTNGLGLETDKTYSVQFNTANQISRIYLFFITQKQLVISRGMLNVV